MAGIDGRAHKVVVRAGVQEEGASAVPDISNGRGEDVDLDAQLIVVLLGLNECSVEDWVGLEQVDLCKENEISKRE
jgi:hypothetical protein